MDPDLREKFKQLGPKEQQACIEKCCGDLEEMVVIFESFAAGQQAFSYKLKCWLKRPRRRPFDRN